MRNNITKNSNITSIKKPIIRNVICTANLKQKINIVKLSKIRYGIYDQKIYGGRCGYVKTPEMNGRVTIFPSGKMISLGGKNIKKSIKQLEDAKSFLIKNSMSEDIKLTPIVRNIVATIEMDKKLPIEKITSEIPGSVYDPETFAGLILKGLGSCNFLIFASGKIIVTGAKSLKELSTSSFEIIQRLNKFTK